MSETLHPTVVIEGRAPLPDQLVTRQTYLPTELAKQGVQTFFVEAQDSKVYNSSGRISALNLEPGQYAWRLRDIAWEDGDPSAYVDGHGYNSQIARTELATREGFTDALRELGLEVYGVETQNSTDMTDWSSGEFIFLKPNKISDISQDYSTRAQLVRTSELDAKLAEQFPGGALLQRPEKLIDANTLLDHLGVNNDELDPEVKYLHSMRVFTPLWLPASQTPATELRLTDPNSDIGKQFATKLQLLEPELVFDKLPELANLHALAREAFAAKYGKQNYLTFDYLIRDDGSVKILNGLVRALTPNLENQAKEVQRLANATADIEVRQLAKLAIELAK